MMHDFLSGVVSTGFLVAAAFFLQFWRRTKERLFLFFSAAFLLLTAERMVRFFLAADNELVPYVYCLRLVAFLLIIAAIIDKNKRA